ncbi:MULTISPECIES: MlaD family protein [unclassified Variovorax]|uniref:MlaD family protein n=1 Tax=unclassified Variovorax TaxID=663243 RepID=UPI003F45D24A
MIWLIPTIAVLVGIALIAWVLLRRGPGIDESLRTTEGLDACSTQFLLHVEDAGLLSVGSPVFFRRIKVGQVAACELDGDGRGALLRILVNAPYDNFEGANTRFWHTSGFGLQFISSGATLSTSSLTSSLLWGIVFGAPGDVGGPAAWENTSFAPLLQPDDSK